MSRAGAGATGSMKLSTGGLIGLAVILIALAITTTTASAASTRAEYIAQADPICAGTVKARQKSARGITKDIARRRDGRAARKIARSNRRFSRSVDQIAAIAPPPADARLIGDWITLLRSEVPLVKRVIVLLRHHASDRRIARALTRLFARSNRAQELVAGYGFTWCNRL